jgi:hypothetical protein
MVDGKGIDAIQLEKLMINLTFAEQKQFATIKQVLEQRNKLPDISEENYNS